MQGLQLSLFLSLLLLWSTSAVAGESREPIPHFSTAQTSSAQTAEDVADSENITHIAPTEISSEPVVFHVPGALFIKLHFSRFRLPQGAAIEIRNPEGSESYHYSKLHRDGFTFDSHRGDDGKSRFYAMSISGDTVVVRISGDLSRFKPDFHRVEIDSYLAGNSTLEGGASTATPKKAGHGPAAKIETTCGQNERYDAVCWANSFPDEYDRSRPVAVLITSQGEECTAWRVGAENYLFTAQHCISSQSDLDGSEIWFNYETVNCGGLEKTDVVKVTGNQLFASDSTLDFTLFSVHDFSRIAEFGNLGLDVRNGVLGEGIFIPQHGLGKPKQLALESDMNSSGFCQIDDVDHNGYASETDLGYFCDTTTSSSGSPVISSATGKAIALHHLGGCFNSGSKISLIWPLVSGYFGGSIPQGDSTGNWDSGNTMPLAEFSLDCTELYCTFDAAQSSDSDGSVVAWSWDLGDGSTASGVSMEHNYASQGSFEVQLTVEDDEGGTDTLVQLIEVSASNTAPTAKFSTGCIDLSCEFDANGSSDGDGSVVDWSWDLGDGAAANGSNISHVYSTAGTYSITLTVLDDDGASDSTTYTAALTIPNEGPVADFSITCTELSCTFDAAQSSDSDGSIVGWSWDLGDGGAASGAEISHTYSTAGTYSITLAVLDDDGASGSTTNSTTLSSGNQEPVASFSIVCSDLECSFDGRASVDPDGNIAAYRWNFGDGQNAKGEVVNYSYAAEGDFTVTLTVKDNRGAFSSSSQLIAVGSSNLNPVASFSATCSDLECSFDAGASVDPDGSIAAYSWNFGDGQNAMGEVVNYSYAGDGNFTVTLTVKDNKGAFSSNSQAIAVGSPKQNPEIELQGTAVLKNQRPLAILLWSGAQSTRVDIYRDGKMIRQTVNDGKYNDTKLRINTKSASYWLCETGTNYCSDKIIMNFKDDQ